MMGKIDLNHFWIQIVFTGDNFWTRRLEANCEQDSIDGKDLFVSNPLRD